MEECKINRKQNVNLGQLDTYCNIAPVGGSVFIL